MNFFCYFSLLICTFAFLLHHPIRPCQHCRPNRQTDLLGGLIDKLWLQPDMPH